MVRTAAAVLLTLVLPRVSSAEIVPRVRVLDRVLRGVLDRGMRQSPTLRSLVEKVGDTPILVFVDCDFRLPALAHD